MEFLDTCVKTELEDCPDTMLWPDDIAYISGAIFQEMTQKDLQQFREEVNCK